MTDKQRLFITEYLKDLNATQAAIRAGYSKDTAYSIGQENLNKPELKAAISQKLEEILDENKSTIKAKLIDTLKQFAFDDLEVDIHTDKDGNPLGVSRKDRLKAIELLGKYAALFTEHIKISGHIGHSDVPLNPQEAETYKASIEGLYGTVEESTGTDENE